MSKNLNVLVTHIEFTARPTGEWVNKDMRAEVLRRLENKFHRHKLQDLHLESACSDETRGRARLAPAIDVPHDAKSELHPGTVEWVLAGLKKGCDARKRWWSAGAFVFLLDAPSELEARQKRDGLKVPADMPQKLATIGCWPVPVFVNPQKEVSLQGWDFLGSDINTDQWQLLSTSTDEAFRKLKEAEAARQEQQEDEEEEEETDEEDEE